MPSLHLTADRNKWIEAVSKLTALTQKKRLAWRTAPTPVELSGEILRGGVVYEASYKAKTLRLYETRGDVFSRWYTVLELVDSTNSVWGFPSTQAIDDLLDAVHYQVGQIGEFVDDVLAEAV